MEEAGLRALIEEVRAGALPRRGFVERLLALGIGARAVVPLVNRARVRGAANRLVPSLSVWDNDFAHLHDWYREA